MSLHSHFAASDSLNAIKLIHLSFCNFNLFIRSATIPLVSLHLQPLIHSTLTHSPVSLLPLFVLPLLFWCLCIRILQPSIHSTIAHSVNLSPHLCPLIHSPPVSLQSEAFLFVLPLILCSNIYQQKIHHTCTVAIRHMMYFVMLEWCYPSNSLTHCVQSSSSRTPKQHC